MASALLDSGISDAPLQKFESMTTPLAPEGINVEKAYQTLRTDPAGSVDVFAGALGANCDPH
jgi:hypothetical protein